MPGGPLPGGPLPGGPRPRGLMPRGIMPRGLARRGPLAAGLASVAAIALFSFLGPLAYHSNQVRVNLDLASLPPGAGHPLGTDNAGFDVLGRLMIGGQASLELGLAVAVATTVVGTLYGALAGVAGGIADAVMMRVVDVFLAVPGLVLLLLLVNLFTPNLLIIIALLTVLSWLRTARLVRGEVLALRARDFVLAARLSGTRTGSIMIRHLIPNSIGVIVVSATFTVSDAILLLSALSFLGLGLPPPYADWGTMLSNGLEYLYDGYWWTVYPTAAILIATVLGFNLIGDAIRDWVDGAARAR